MADTVLDATFFAFVKSRGWRLRAEKNKPYLEDRLRASFVWKRMSDLLPLRGGAALPGLLTQELTIVNDFLTSRLGADRNSGTLLQARPPNSTDATEHLDLEDLAHQRASAFERPGDAQTIRLRADRFRTARRDAVLSIVWRAVALERTLWLTDTSLDQAALSELLDRRLRVVERMRCNVGNSATMIRENGTRWNFHKGAVDQPSQSANWLDALRVRLFEYPYFPLAAWDYADQTKWEKGLTSISYDVVQTITRKYTDGSQDTEPFEAGCAWRFPPSVAENFVVSPGRDTGYRIDLVSATRTAASAIDDVFNYRDENGTPRKADAWNRAWLLCDHVVSLLHIEALLFGLRRARPQDGADVFNALCAKFPIVPVPQGENSPPKEAKTGYVSLDAHIPSSGAGADNVTPTVLMRSTESTNPAYVDPYFRNTTVPFWELQVGDQVRFLNSPVFSRMSAGTSAWGMENAVVSQLDPQPDFGPNRLAFAGSRAKFIGHGTDEITYSEMRRKLGRFLALGLATIFRIIKDNTSEDHLQIPAMDNLKLLRWAPYADLVTLRIDKNLGLDDNPEYDTLISKPWWILMPTVWYGNDVLATLNAIPHSIGKPDVRGLTLEPIPDAWLGLPPGNTVLDFFVLFPLFEPALAPDAITDMRLPLWTNYFIARRGSSATDLRSIDPVRDTSLVPNLFCNNRMQGTQADVPVIQPKPHS